MGDACADALPSVGTLHSADGCDANLFVLSVQRMRRKRHERAKSSRGGTGGGDGTGGPLSPVKSAAANCPVVTASGQCEDPLEAVPFDIWSVEAVGKPPGAPEGGLLEKAPSRAKHGRGRSRGAPIKGR